MPRLPRCLVGVGAVVVVVAVALLASGAAGYGDTLERRKVHLLDVWTPAGGGASNYLFRGNQPTQINATTGQRSFAWADLAQYMADAVVNATLNGTLVPAPPPLPDAYYMTDYKLFTLNSTNEDIDIDMELDFFAANPTLGECVPHRVHGTLTSPFVLPRLVRDEMARTLDVWMYDHLPSFIDALHQQLTTPAASGLSQVLYFHCECGCDRTGEIAGAYMMAYGNMTYDQVIAWDDAIAGRDIEPFNRWALEWMCLYLVQERGFPNMNCDAVSSSNSRSLAAALGD